MNRAGICVFYLAITLNMALYAEESAGPYFAITVVDEQTGRGVPLVELRTISEIRYYTDSNGVVAFFEPGLMGRKVYFHVKSHGYEFPTGDFGFRGTILDVKSGGSATIKIKRINIAERLYRLTGEGVYRDSILVGKTPPTHAPLLNGQVTGQDSVQMTEYGGKWYWFFGDTNKPGFPLGHFGTSGAVSDKPEQGGLNPDVGVNLVYFQDRDGFARPMYPPVDPGMKWIDSVVNVPDENGKECLVGKCSRHKTLEEVYERTLVLFDNKKNEFVPVHKFDKDDPLQPVASAFKFKTDGQEYVYFTTPFPCIRVKADLNSMKDSAAYESFTCLQVGARFDKNDPKLERGPDGHLIWGWKANTAPVMTFGQQKELLHAGKISPAETWYKLSDAATGLPILAAVGTVNYNAFRKKWIMIFNESSGKSSELGEIWYSEADAPEGPWLKARKIVTHDRYSFYNVAQHPQFDQDGGRVIYFEGTYTITFSGNLNPTPRYEYNQIMYKLDLADPRLKM